MPPPILQPYQVPHRDALKTILLSHFGALDRSRPGTGKTYTATSLALEIGFRYVVVICEPLAVAKWSEMAREYGLPILTIITYNRLRATKDKQPKHGLLERTDEVTEGGINKTNFHPTPQLIQLCQAGFLLIVDEIQHITSGNDQGLAVKAITNCIVANGGQSRYLFLSGTYATKEEQVIHLLRLMSLVRHSRLYHYMEEENRLILLGAKELIDYCTRLDETKTLQVIEREQLNEKNVHKVCFALFCEVIKEHLVSSMIKPVSEEMREIKLHCKNLYVNLPEDEAEALASSIGLLNRSTGYSSARNEIDMREVNWGALIKARLSTETNKVNAAVRTAERWLDENPNQKVVLYFNFTEPLMKAKEQLSQFAPLILNGQVKPEVREAYRQAFQKSDTEYRLLLCNIAVASENIDLDDKDGRFPRKVLMMPDYKTIALHQASYRFLRQDTRSSTDVYFFWCKCGQLESSIINALARKNAVMKKLHDDQVEQGIKFPGEYEDEIEPDIPALGIGGVWKAQNEPSRPAPRRRGTQPPPQAQPRAQSEDEITSFLHSLALAS